MKQKESGVIILPYLWSVEIAPKDLEIGVAVDKELVPGVTTIDIQEYQGKMED